MGFFGTYLYDGEQWTPCERDDLPSVIAEPWLLVDIYDSDYTEIVYRPAGPGSGVAFLGDTPRAYFQDEGASAPTDVAREAKGLAFWWARVSGDDADAPAGAKAAELVTYLADDTGPAEGADADEPELDDGDVFVEVKTARFVDSLDLPPIEELPQ